MAKNFREKSLVKIKELTNVDLEGLGAFKNESHSSKHL